MFTYWGLCVYSTNMPLVEFFHFLTINCLKISILHLCRQAFSQNHFWNNSCTLSAISIKKWKFAIDSVETYQSQPLISYRKKALSLLKEGSIARICYWGFKDSPLHDASHSISMSYTILSGDAALRPSL